MAGISVRNSTGKSSPVGGCARVFPSSFASHLARRASKTEPSPFTEQSTSQSTEPVPHIDRIEWHRERPRTDGPSLLPLLEDPKADWEHVSTTFLNRPNDYSISDRDWRYIHYNDGSEELYQISADPHEWRNLAAAPQHESHLQYFRSRAPKDFRKYVPISINAMPKLKWIPIADSQAPPSQPDGQSFDCYFINKKKADVNCSGSAPKGTKRVTASLPRTNRNDRILARCSLDNHRHPRQSARSL